MVLALWRSSDPMFDLTIGRGATRRVCRSLSRPPHVALFPIRHMLPAQHKTHLPLNCHPRQTPAPQDAPAAPGALFIQGFMCEALVLYALGEVRRAALGSWGCVWAWFDAAAALYSGAGRHGRCVGIA